MKPTIIHFVSTTVDRKPVVKIIFDYSRKICARLKEGPEPFWSSTLKCWCVDDESTTLRKWHHTFKNLDYSIDLTKYKKSRS